MSAVELKKQRQHAKGALTRALRKIKYAITDEDPADMVKASMEQAEQALGAVEDIHQDYLDQLHEEKQEIIEEAEEAYIQAEINRTRAEVYAAKVYLKEITATGTTHAARQVSSGAPVQMERIPIPGFKGGYSLWPTFLSSWTKVVETNYPPEFWAIMLRDKLGGEAAELVSACDDNYEEMMKRLKRKYGDRKKVSETIISEIKDVRPINVGNNNALIKFIEKIERADTKLRSLNMLEEISTSSSLAEIERRLPEDIRNEWARFIVSKDEEERQNPYQFLIPFLLKEKDRIEYLGTSARKQVSISSHFQELHLDSEKQKEKVSPARSGMKSLGKVRKTYYTCCACESNEHLNKVCETFKKATVSDRRRMILEHGACFRCFGNHMYAQCKGTGECKNCKESNHHTLLCKKETKAELAQKQESSSRKSIMPRTTSATASAGTNSDTLLNLMTVAGPKRTKTINVLWDSGSTGMFVTHACARTHGFLGREKIVDVETLQGHIETLRTKIYQVTIRDKSGQAYSFHAYGLNSITGDISPVDMGVVGRLFPGVSVGGLERPRGTVDLLIGNHKAGWQPQPHVSDGKHLFIMENIFGQCLGGSHPSLSDETTIREECWRSASTHCGIRAYSTQVLLQHPAFEPCKDSVRKTQKITLGCTRNHAGTTNCKVSIKPPADERDSFFRVEALGTEVACRCGGCRCGKCPIPGHTYSLKEEYELDLIRQGLRYDAQRMVWIAKYPWIVNKVSLPNNYSQALSSLASCERGLAKNSDWGKTYGAQIQDMVTRNAARKLSDEEISAWQGPVFYLCHLAALNPKSSSTPVRIVFDSSRKAAGGLSLNECLAKGPDNYLNNMLGVFCRFREGSFAMQADIKKMYNSVEIDEEDQHCHRFLWRNCDSSAKPSIYVIRVVNIGDRPAGAIASEALYMTADLSAKEHPEAARMIKESSYVDDLLDCCGSREEGLALAQTVENTLAKGNFQVKGWRFSGEPSNSEQKLKPLADSKDGARVLGVVWDPVEDAFRFTTKINFSKRVKKVRSGPDVQLENLEREFPEDLTRRMVMSQVMCIFDPCGFLIPVTMRAKVLLRETWELRLDWDDKLPPELHRKWFQFFKQLYEVHDLRFERCLRPANALGDPMLILFSDGSEIAFGAVAYVRWQLLSGHFDCQLVMAKCRIAPLKRQSIPRLELSGAVLAKRIRKFLEEEMRYNFSEVIHLVDSKTVLGMLNKTSTRFSPYMGVRVGEIQAASLHTDDGRLKEWAWLQGSQNIADWTTRGKKPSDLSPSSHWAKGPPFLYTAKSKWPVEYSVPSELPAIAEERPALCAVAKCQVKEPAQVMDINRFGSLKKLLNVTVLIDRLTRRKDGAKFSFRGKAVTPPTTDEVEKARNLWIKAAQAEIIEELKSSSGNRPSTSGKFVRLAPMADVDGIWRIGERARHHVPFTDDHQLPPVLPYGNRLTELFMLDSHQNGHLGIAGTLAKFRRKYWVVQGGKLAKKIRNACVICKKLDHKHEKQVMGPLPEELLKPAPPWSITGLDLFGPLSIRGEVNKRTTGKAYGVVFVCLLSKAVHLELVDGYSTSSFLMGLRRFSAVRGWPKKLYSDRGSQLTGAASELEKMWSALDTSSLERLAAGEGFQWEFSPANSPWRQGTPERIIGWIKRSLKVIIGDTRLSFSELQTALYECMQLANERPIGVKPKEDGNHQFLCPNDLLLGRASATVPAGPWDFKASTSVRLRLVQHIANSFWSRWMQECAPNLVVRRKWHHAERNIAPGDLVWIADANAERGNYKLGIVEKVRCGSDGKVRTCTVKYKNTKYTKRPLDYKPSEFIAVERAVQRLVVILPHEESN